MDDSFQFIIESPQHTQGHKKRPRLVTSCDNCRLKKIKCLQPSPETKCEACKAAKIQCRFRDRERYFAERSRAIAGPAAQPYGEDHRAESNSSFDYSSSGAVSPDDEPGGRYQSYPPDPRRPSESHRHAGTSSMTSFHSRTEPIGYNFVSSNSPPHIGPHSRPSSRGQIHLFDPEQPQMPHPSLMPHFIQIFFEQMGNEFNYLSYDDVTAQHWDQRLPPPLANCIAALAARFSNLPELTVRGVHNVADVYADTAKTLVSSVAHLASLDTLYALMLLSWLDYKHNRMSGFRTYYHMSMKMAMELGISDQNTIAMIPSESERNRRRAAWNGVLQIHMTATSYRQ